MHHWIQIQLMFKKLQKTWKTFKNSFIIDRCQCVNNISAFWCLYQIIITKFKVIFLWWIFIIFFAKCPFISVEIFKNVVIVLTVIILNIFFHDFVYNSVQKIKTFAHNFSSLFDCCKKNDQSEKLPQNPLKLLWIEFHVILFFDV